MTWHFLDKILDEASKQSTIIGKVWVVVIFIFRIVVLSKIGEPLYADEQAAFNNRLQTTRCNTRQPGCENVCFNLFSPISHPRFWGLQILFTVVPSMIYIIYAAHITSKYPYLQKPKKPRKKKKRKKSKNHKITEKIKSETLKQKSQNDTYDRGYRKAKDVLRSVISFEKLKDKVQSNPIICSDDSKYINQFSRWKHPARFKDKNSCRTLEYLNYSEFENSVGKSKNSVRDKKEHQLVSRTPRLLPSSSNKTLECRINKYFSSYRPSTDLKCQVFPHINSFSMRSNQFIFDKNKRKNLRESSNCHEVYNLALGKSSTDTKSFKPRPNRNKPIKLAKVRSRNVIMEVVRLSEIQRSYDGRVMHTNSFDSYQITQNYKDKRTLSFTSTSTNRYSNVTFKNYQRKKSIRNCYFGPVEASSPIPKSLKNKFEGEGRLKTLIQTKNEHYVLPSPLPSTILAENKTSPTLVKLKDTPKSTFQLEETSKKLTKDLDTSAKTVSKELKIKDLEKKIEIAYFIQSILRLTVEGMFLLAQYLYFDLNVPKVFHCQRWPCPNEVNCYISRPQEKTVMIWFMFSLTGFCVLLAIIELLIMLQRFCWRCCHSQQSIIISPSIEGEVSNHVTIKEPVIHKNSQGLCTRRPKKFLRLRSITLIQKEEEDVSESTVTSSSSSDSDDSDKSIDSKALSSIYDNDQSYDVGSFNDGADDFDNQVQEDMGQMNHDVSLNSF